MNASTTIIETPAIPEPLRATLRITAKAPEGALHETADEYAKVLFLAPGGRLRIITCRDGIQWIVQTRRPLASKHPRPWLSKSFCTSRKGICRSLKEHLQAGFPELEGFLNTLPETIRHRRNSAE